MFEDPLDPVLRQALSDRFDAGELAAMLALTVEQILLAFPDEVDAMEDELRDVCGLSNDEEDNDAD